jgi:hypothetical protein
MPRRRSRKRTYRRKSNRSYKNKSRRRKVTRKNKNREIKRKIMRGGRCPGEVNGCDGTVIVGSVLEGTAQNRQCGHKVKITTVHDKSKTIRY